MAKAKPKQPAPTVPREGMLRSAKLMAREAAKSLEGLGEEIHPGRALINLELLSQAEELLQFALGDVRLLKQQVVAKL